jgi:hypothetical protein
LTKRATGGIAFEEGLEKVSDVAKNALAVLRISFVRENVTGDVQRVVEVWGRRGLSFWSWGENIGIKISRNERGGSLVEAISECIWPFQIFDNGTNKKNLESLFAALKMQLRAVESVHLEEKRWGSE